MVFLGVVLKSLSIQFQHYEHNMKRPYVSDISNGEIVIEGLDWPLPDWLVSYSVTKAADASYRIAASDAQQHVLLQALRDGGFAFAGGSHGWPPAEIFADMRERGLVHGDFEEIVFRQPGAAVLRRR
jgi:hypothetical protein